MADISCMKLPWKSNSSALQSGLERPRSAPGLVFQVAGEGGRSLFPGQARNCRRSQSSRVMSLDQPHLLEQALLELGDVVRSRLGILPASNGEIVLVLLLGQQLEELRHVPHVLLPIQRRSPGPVPGAVSYVLRIRVHGLDGRLTAGRRKLMLDVRRQP